MRVLLAESHIPDVLADTFARAGMMVTTTSQGQAAILEGIEGEHDAIVLDSLLHNDVPGVLVLEWLRTAQVDVPILFFSASTNPREQRQEQEKVFNLGADDYMLRPSCPDDLARRVRALALRTKNLVHVNQNK